MTLLCLAPHCRKPGSHATDCKAEPDKPCRGCLPAQAADGLYLCWRDVLGLGRNAVEAAALHDELAMALTARGGASEVRVAAAHPGLAVRDPVVEHRATIRQTLVSWTLLVTEERGIGLPWYWRTIALPDGVHGPLRRLATVDHNTTSLGKFIATHALWLAGQRFGAEAAGELRTLVTTGRSLRQLSGTSVVPIGPCPRDGQDGRCEGTLKALMRRDSPLLPSVVVCDVDETHSWDSTQWTKLGRAMGAKAA